jgi:phosphatidate cytidylyltransferase
MKISVSTGHTKWSDLARRAITIAATVPVLLVVAMRGPSWAWAALTGIAIAIAGAEFVTLLSKRRTGWAWAGAMACVAAGAALYFERSLHSWVVLLAILASLALTAFLAVVFRSMTHDLHRRDILTAFVFVGLASLYSGALPAHIALIRRDAGSAWLIFALALAWGSDAGAYMVGKLIGGPKLAPRVSPSKTLAGAVAGLVTAALIGVIFARACEDGIHTTRLVLIAIVGGLLSQIGDLAESSLKRRCGAKDSGVAIPGHGGMLDCIDGLILAAPWLYYAHSHLV